MTGSMQWRRLMPRGRRPMRVVIDARIRSGELGGIESVIIGLASGLAGLADADDEYLFLCLPGEESFLAPYLGANSHIVHLSPPPPPRLHERAWRKAVATLPVGQGGQEEPLSQPELDPNVPPFSDGTVERLGADLVHFTSQAAFQTEIPSIYHPHDLQHVHLPQFFSEELIAWREGWYRTLCHRAAMVAVASFWTKRDVEQHYGLPPDKVRVVPMAPPTAAYRAMDVEEAAAIRQRLGVPGEYILYPAQTWEHKNHVGLLEALALLSEERDLAVPLVAPGQQNDFYPQIRQIQTELGLDGQVTWPGFVSPDELKALYEGARAVVIPSWFEAASFPLWEAFAAGSPAACSDVTSLPEQAGNAALVFDPGDPISMASAIERLWTDETLRAELVEHGHDRIGQLSWGTTARIFRAHYRRLTGAPMTAEDVGLTSERGLDGTAPIVGLESLN